MVPKQAVFSVESSVRTPEVKESNEDGAFQRKGTSLICIQFADDLKLMALILAFLFQTHPPQSLLSPGGGLPSTGCAE